MPTPLVSDRESSQTSESPAGSGDSSGPSVEGSVMVSNSSGDALGLSSVDSSLSGSFLMTSNSVAMSFQPQLAVWPISGRSLLVKTFQAQLGISSWSPGGPSPTRPTIPTSINGYAGALQGVRIPFLDL